MKTVLTVAGSDPTGGAGIQADLKTFARFRVRGFSVVTALTAQGIGGVDAVFPIEGRIVAAQLEPLRRGCEIHAVKVGMLFSRETVLAFLAWLDRWRGTTLVVDPILRSGTGVQLLRPDALEVFRAELLPRATLLTPNLDEAAELAGVPVRDAPSMEEAARRLHGMGSAAVLIKGGHLAGGAMDLLYDGQSTMRWETPRIQGRVHGAGCALSSAIAAGLARGRALPDAVFTAKTYVARAIAAGCTPAPDGPRFLDHSVDQD